MLESEAVRKIGFTGSTAVGKQLMAGAAQTVKKVSLELGGNAPYIIFDDADIELAATGVVTSAFRNAGQTCICANKILVQVSSVPTLSLVYIQHHITLQQFGKNVSGKQGKVYALSFSVGDAASGSLAAYIWRKPGRLYI